MADSIEVRTGRVAAPDGVEIAYSTTGRGRPALIFVHGGLANHRFWEAQVPAFCSRHQVVTLDLAGHGQSGTDRRSWSIPMFGQDVKAVVDDLSLERCILIGNSLGGPAALEAAALLKGRALAVIGVDTFHDMTVIFDSTAAQARAEAFGNDPRGATREMVRQLFHPGAHPDLQTWAEAQMQATPTRVVVPMLTAFGGYDMTDVARRANVPVRSINGDLWPTRADKNRTVVPSYEALIIPDSGHYLMLENPDPFNNALERTLRDVEAATETRR